MFGLLLVLLLNEPLALFEMNGQLTKRPRSRFPTVRLESVDGRTVKQTYVGLDGKFRFNKLPEGQYFMTVRVGRGRLVHQTVSILPAFADKKHRVPVKVDVDKAVTELSTQKASVTALQVPQKARAELRKAFEAKGDIPKVQKHLEAAIEIAPHFEEALNNLGTIHYRNREYVKAKDLFERAIKANPESFTAHVNLGGTLISLDEYDRALEENTKAVALRSSDPLAQAQLGMSYFYLRRFDEAIPCLQRAKERDPYSPALPGLFIASIHEATGNHNAAIAEYEEFLKRHPGHTASQGIERRIASLKRNQQP